MAEFELILLSEVPRLPQQAHALGIRAVIPYRTRLEMMAERLPSLEEIAKWPLANEVFRQTAEAFGDLARHNLWEWLRGGQIQAAAESAGWDDRVAQHERTKRIKPEWWDHVTNLTNLSNFWTTSQITFKISYFAGAHDVIVRFFSVRLDPSGVQTMLATAPPRPRKKVWVRKPSPLAAPAPQPEPPQEEPPEKGPPVAQQHLEAWYQVYRMAYIGAADTEANAVASARGMFPGKSVSRDRVRELRGEQKRGRKPGDAAK